MARMTVVVEEVVVEVEVEVPVVKEHHVQRVFTS